MQGYPSILRHLLFNAFVALVILSTPVSAHETAPTVIDLRVEGPVVTLTLAPDLEALLAGRAQHDDSAGGDGGDGGDGAAADAQYARLRALPASALAARFTSFEPEFRKGLSLALDGDRLVLVPGAVIAGPPGAPGDARTPRAGSSLVYSATLPEQAGRLIWTYDAAYGDSILRYYRGDGPEPLLADFLEPGVPAELPLSGPAPKSALGAFTSYIGVGFDHIIPRGLDHILFVIGLFLLAARLRPLIWQVSMFTLAHTITLALGALGWVNLPGAVVEPVIAASIAYVAIENLFTQRLHPWRPALVFAFGLLHGLGFAAVLGDFGLPDGQFIAALIGFNIGVELGQIVVIALCFALVGYWFRDRSWYHRVIVVPASLAIAIIALYWVVERTGLIA